MLINNFTATNTTYKRSLWPLFKTIEGPDGGADMTFGKSVSANDAGTIVVIGANSKTHIFYKDEGGTDNWGLKKTIAFGGQEVSINESGTMIASSNNVDVEVYYKDEGGADNWGLKKTINSSTYEAPSQSSGLDGLGGYFGSSLDIKNNRLVIGDRGANYQAYHGGKNPYYEFSYQVGALWIFYKDDGGTDNWGLVKQIYGTGNPFFNTSWGQFGHRAHFNSTADKLLVKNVGKSSGLGTTLNTMTVFSKDDGGTDNWGGLSVSINPTAISNYFLAGFSKDGNIAVVIDYDGSIYIHKKDEGGTDAWGRSQTIDIGLNEVGETNADTYGHITFHPTNSNYFIIGINRPDDNIGAIAFKQGNDGYFGIAQVLKDEDYITTNLNLNGLHQWRSSLLNGGYYLNAAEYPIEAAIAYDHDLVQYTDETTAATNDTDNDVTLLPTTPAVDDAYYFGSSKTFTSITIDFGASGGGGVWTLAWEYWNGSAWTALADVIDDTDGFTATGVKSTSFTLPGDWATTTVNSQGPFYYIRAKVSTYTSVVQNPVVKKLTIGGGNPNVTLPDAVIENKEVMTEIFGTPITQISNGEWWYGDADTLGYDTIYISLSDNTDPNTKPYYYIQSGVEVTNQFKDLQSSLYSSNSSVGSGQIALSNNLLFVGGNTNTYNVNIHELGDVTV